MSDEAPLVRIWLTNDPDLIATGTIPEYLARIVGDFAYFEIAPGQSCAAVCEGTTWHKTRWAAENYAIAIRNLRIGQLREELAKLERYTFGRRP